MPVVFHEYDLSGFRAYLEEYKRRGAVLRATFLHHTWSPTPATWRGLPTMEGIRRAHLARSSIEHCGPERIEDHATRLTAVERAVDHLTIRIGSWAAVGMIVGGLLIQAFTRYVLGW